MKPERPDDENIPEGLPGREHDYGESGITDDLPVLRPLNVKFGRKDALKRSETEEFLAGPGFPVLIPPSVVYPHKASLRRKPAGTRVFALVAEALSAAAIIIILLTLFKKGPDTITIKPAPVMTEVASESAGEEHETEIPVNVMAEQPGRMTVSQAGTESDATVITNVAVAPESPIVQPEAAEEVRISSGRTYRAYMAELPAPVLSPALNAGNTLSLLTYKGELPAMGDPDLRSNVEKFAARFFHEKIMNNEEAGDSPVTAVDLAEAGVRGFNRLLGTGMELVRNTNESGDLVSVYFGSQTLKINAPVRRDEPSL